MATYDPIPHTLDYSVWSEHKMYLEEPAMTKCMAQFCFFQEALDFVDYCVSRGVRCVLRGPYGLASVYPK